MLVNQNQSRNWSAISAVNVSEGRGDAVMSMNASYNGGTVNFAENIQNMELYLANKATVDADYATFKENVWADIGE